VASDHLASDSGRAKHMPKSDRFGLTGIAYHPLTSKNKSEYRVDCSPLCYACPCDRLVIECVAHAGQ
jgi:hypothetical protein